MPDEREPDPCPFCGVELNDGLMMTRKIGIEVRGAYDGVLWWRCPDCSGDWHRFPSSHDLHARAAQYIGSGDVPEPAEPPSLGGLRTYPVLILKRA